MRTPQEIYAQACAACHDSGAVPRAPHAIEFQMMGPAPILAALESGVMKQQGDLLSATERLRLAEFLGGASLPSGEGMLSRCDADHASLDLQRPPMLDGWGLAEGNTRHIPAAVAGLGAADLPRLRLKWAFGYPGATRARSQPAAGGGALYTGSQDGIVYALDLATGCVRWTFKAAGEVRSSPVLEPWTTGDLQARPRLFFGDFRGNAYAVDASTGTLLWTRRVGDHPHLTLTGSVRLHEGRLYVPMSSTEWAAAADPSYACCTFRGGVVALSANSGEVLWRSHAIPDAEAGSSRAVGAGAPVWNSPTIDARRRRLYVGTGQAYTAPAAAQSDAVLAFDLDDGRLLWWHQTLSGDAWNMACLVQGRGRNCPAQEGPDFDIGAAVILHRLPDGRELLLAGQKSGHAMAIDPDNGKLLWKQRYGRGGLSGGVHWGMAANGGVLYVPIADTTVTGREEGEARPGLNAVDAATGRLLWHAAAPEACHPDDRPSCDPGYSAPVTSIPGAVFAPSFDGHLRAYAAEDGRLLWDEDTNAPVVTGSGAEAHGGSIESVGAVVVDGMVAVPSGYLFGTRMPGNVLLVYSIDGQ
ncbi:outer membrane protein assembly factor BamB family protein [Luteimonas sp. A501]